MSGAPGAQTRMAPDVPTMSAARSGVTQPAPTFEHAPSPSAGSHGTRARAGHRPANLGLSPRSGESRSAIGAKCSGVKPTATSAGPSHVCPRWSKSPVPDAIETLARVSPNRRRWTYSPNDIQRRTRPKAAGSRSASQTSRAGRYEVWKTHPTRAW